MNILCAGLAICDLLLRPVDLDNFTREVTAAEYIQLATGGDALNVAKGIASLGGKPGLLARVGRDDLGEYLVTKAQQSGIDVSRIKKVERPTSANGVLIRSDGERVFLTMREACQSLCAEDFTDECLEGVDLLFIGSAFELPGLDGEGMVQVMKKAREKGIKTALDTTGEPTPESMSWFADVLRYTDYFLPSLREATFLTGCSDPEQAAYKFAELGISCVAVKMGEEGSLVLDNGVLYRVPAFRAKVKDTTGAGDAFVAGFLRGLQQGMEPVKCAVQGSALGSLAVESIGAGGYVTDAGEIARRMQIIEG